MEIILGLLFFLLFFFLLLLITGCCYTKINFEKFTAPGLTLTKPPSWFPQNAAKAYNPEDWKTKMYLDRYPFRINNKGENCSNSASMGGDGPGPEYITTPESNFLASTYRMWKLNP